MSNVRFPIKAAGKIKHAEVFWAEPPAYAECATLRTGLLGVCLFHRTWANNLFLDFLAAHPATMDLRAPIRGVGTGLLFALCDISLQLKAPLIWGETTNGSVSYYRDVFGLPDLTDQLAVPAAAQSSFHELTRRKWSAVK